MPSIIAAPFPLLSNHTYHYPLHCAAVPSTISSTIRRYVGTYASPAVSLRSTLPQELGLAAVMAAVRGLKSSKALPRKVVLTVGRPLPAHMHTHAHARHHA